MTKTQYAQERKDPRWQKKRLEIMNRDQFCCVDCGSEDKTLNVHHNYYISGRKPWQYPDWSLSTLCWECHEARHSTEHDDESTAAEEKPWEAYIEWLRAVFEEDEMLAPWTVMLSLAQLFQVCGPYDMEKITEIKRHLNSLREKWELENAVKKAWVELEKLKEKNP